MNSKHLLGAAMFATFLFPFSSASQESRKDVQSLHRMCKASGANVELSFCLGFISGVAEQMILTGQLASLLRKDGGLADERERKLLLAISSCSGKASFGAMVQAFTNWAEKHPEEWTSSRQLGVMKALSETWPCK
jgi:hypothetical protein